MEPAGGVLPSIAPGWGFLVLLAVLVLAGLGLHAVFLRVLGESRVDRWTRNVEGLLFCFLLAVMLALSALQVFLRNLFHTGILWIDPLVRTLVLWIGFLGALTATSRARHLHIDILHRLLPPGVGVPVSRVLSLVSAVCCALLASGSYLYISEERAGGMEAFLGIPVWAAELALLWGFGLMSYRFLVQVIWPTRPHPLP